MEIGLSYLVLQVVPAVRYKKMYSIPYVICGQSGLAHDSISFFHPIAILAEGGSHDPKKDREVDLGPQRAPGDEST